MVWYQSTSDPVDSPSNSGVCWTTSGQPASDTFIWCVPPIRRPDSGIFPRHWWPRLRRTSTMSSRGCSAKPLREQREQTGSVSQPIKSMHSVHASAPSFLYRFLWFLMESSGFMSCFVWLNCLKTEKTRRRKKKWFWSRPTAVSLRAIAHLILWCFAFHVRFMSMFVIHLCESEPAGSPRRPKQT